MAIRAILGRDTRTPALWAALSGGTEIAGDSSPRAFHVEVKLRAVSASDGRVRLRLAAAEYATVISGMTLSSSDDPTRRHPVTFDGRTERRLPPGAVLESDPVRSPDGTHWSVAFRSTPLALVRVKGAASTELSPVAPGGVRGTVDGALGLVAIVDDPAGSTTDVRQGARTPRERQVTVRR